MFYALSFLQLPDRLIRVFKFASLQKESCSPFGTIQPSRQSSFFILRLTACFKGLQSGMAGLMYTGLYRIIQELHDFHVEVDYRYFS
jgi:hypothetical protein